MVKRFFITVSLVLTATQAWAAFGYYSPISINAAQVPSTQTNFPVLVSVTDARFKDVAHSGHVQSASGYDIRPYSDAPPLTPITGYELERYDATTGEVVMWVKVGSLTSSSTPIYLAYGDATLTTDGSSTTTWSNSFVSVFHLKDGTTFSVTDSLGTHNGTNHSATANTGQIDGGGGFVSASSQYVDCGGAWSGAAAMTISGWVKGTTFPAAENCPFGRIATSPGNTYLIIEVKSTGKLEGFAESTAGDVSYNGTGATTLSTGTWYHLAAVWKRDTTANGGGLTVYVNAAVDKLVTSNNQDLTTTTAPFYIGQDALTAGRFWNGSLDEIHVSSTTRSADWITTEYNNQVAPGTFETLGTEVAGATSMSSFWF